MARVGLEMHDFVPHRGGWRRHGLRAPAAILAALTIIAVLHSQAIAGTGISLEAVSSPYDIVFRNQAGIPVRVDIANLLASPIMVQDVRLLFTLGSLNDRADDYAVSTAFSPTVVMPGETLSVNLLVTVGAAAILDTLITIDGAATGIRIDDETAVSDTFALDPHEWTVVEQAVNAIAALYYTRQTTTRSDDSLVALVSGENFLLNRDHVLNGGEFLGDLPIGSPTFYRFVLQLHPSADWDWEPKSTAKGYFEVGGASRAFGRQAAPIAGVRELLITNSFVPDENTDLADIVIGATKSASPPVPWSMTTDPWTDSRLDTGMTGEIGTITENITALDPDKTWEVTAKLEKDRYTFLEFWFQPDLEWLSGDTADVALYIEGKPNPSNIEKLHVRFRLVDDDTIPPVFSDFAPEIVPAGSAFNVSCAIADPSGVYDDATGSSGQGVYLLWDDDGSLVDDANEIAMSSIGGGYYRTDTPIPSQMTGEEVVFRIYACDNDFDGNVAADRMRGSSDLRIVQIVGSVYLVDEPSSLYPASVRAGETGVSFHIEIGNPNGGSVTLSTASTISFTDGTRTITARLLNETSIPAGAGHFPVAFEAVDVPEDFSAPDTVAAVLDVTYYYNLLWRQQIWKASETNRLEVRERLVRFTAYPVSGGIVHPGAGGVELLSLGAANESAGAARLDSLTVTNVTVGSGGVPLSDADFGVLRLYRRSALFAARSVDSLSGAAPFDSIQTTENFASDSLLATARLSAGRAVFRIPAGLDLPADRTTFLAVAADVDSFGACDGDSLDLAISDPGAIHLGGTESVVFHRTPLNSASRAIVDGFMRFQISLWGALPDTLFLGEERQLVLSLRVPANGYASDVLTGLSVENYSDAVLDTLVDRLELWLDDGDSLFSASTDVPVGELAWTGSRFEASGLSVPILAPRILFVTASLRLGFVSEAYARFGVPEEGVRFSSGNDGPLDARLESEWPQRVVRWETVTLEALPSSPRFVHPGDRAAELAGFRIHNTTMATLTIDTLRLSGDAALFGCAPGAAITLHLDDGDGSFEPVSDAALASSAWTGGAAFFPDLAIPVGVNESAILFAASDLDSLLTPDGDTLALAISSMDDIRVTRGASVNDELYRFEADFPVQCAASPVTDGMMLHQVAIRRYGDSLIVDRKRNILALDLTIPSNGCRADTCTSLSVLSAGTIDDALIQRVSLYGDDGDGVFEPGLEPLITHFNLAAARTYVPQNAFSVPLPPGGARFYVTVDLQDFGSGGTLRMLVPQGGIEVVSGNDGPVDGILAGETSVIPLPDRITVFASPVGNRRVLPDDRNILNLALSFYNSYSQSQIVDSISFVSMGTAVESEIADVSAFADTDEDGLFNPAVDDLLKTATVENRAYVFDDLELALASYRNTLVFIVYSVPLDGVRDSVSIDFQVISKSSFGFDGEPPVLQGEFPLNSAGLDITDGMAAVQIASLEGPDARVPPGMENVPCFSFVLPCNGTYEDELKGVALENRGTAAAGQDIEYVRLWREAGGDPLSFGPEDEFLAFLAWDGARWRNMSPIAEPLPCGGAAFHVTVDVAASAADGRSVSLVLPVGGIAVASGNDGPVDEDVESRMAAVITTDPLFASFSIPAAVTRGREFEVRMLVANAADTTIHTVVPDSFAWEGSGGLSLVSGPVPAAIDLAGGADSAFVWRFSATVLGEATFRGKAIESGGSAASLLEHSSEMKIEEAPQNLLFVLDDLMPVDLNRGQEGSRVIECVMSYAPPEPRSAGVVFSGLAITFTDGAATPIPASTVVSRIALEDETRVLYASSAGDLAQPTVNCVPDTPVLLEPSDTKTLRISLDIAEGASAASFRLRVPSSAAVALSDENSGVAAPFGGTTFPWSTNTASLNDPASRLAVRLTGTLPPSCNKGQEDVAAFDLVFKNMSGAAGADISVSEVEFRVTDAAGDTIEAVRAIKALRLAGSGGVTRALVEVFGGASTIRCVLQPALVVAAGEPVVLAGLVEVPMEPQAAGFSIELADSEAVAARDANSGAAVAVEPDTLDFPYRTGYSLFRDPARTVAVSGGALLPAKITASEAGVPVLRIIFAHPGGPASSSVRCSAVGVRLLDELGRGIAPAGLIDAIRVRHDADEIASIYITAGHGSDITLSFSSPVIMAAGESDTVGILLDVDADAEPSRLQVHVNASQIVAADATDGERILNLVGDFPLTSGISEIVAPAGAIAFDAEGLLPSNVAAGEETDAFALHFARGSSDGGSLVFIDSLAFDALGTWDVPIDPAAVLQMLHVTHNGTEIASSWSAAGGRIRLALDGAPPIASGSAVDLVISVTPLPNPRAASFTLRIASAADVSCRDELTGGAVVVAPEHIPGFPYTAGLAALLARDAEKAFSNYPNPFVAGVEETRITFFMPAAGRATLTVYTIAGEPVRILLDNAAVAAGLHQDVTWDGTNGEGKRVLNGVYYLLLKYSTGGTEEILKRKVALLR